MVSNGIATEALAPSAESIRAALVEICRSAAFSSAPQLQKLLRYLVEQTLAGNPVKESIVGVAVFGREPGYNPKQDSVVRSEAFRLRSKLLEYYAGEGAQASALISLPKGTYVPAFSSREVPRPRRDRRSRPVIAWAAGIGLAVAAIVLGIYRYPHAAARVGKGSPRRSVAVLDFRNLTRRADAEWMAAAIPEMIRADLASGQQIRIIPGENVARMESELPLPQVSTPSLQTLAAVRRNLGADIVISGAYADLGTAAMRIDIWAQDAQSGEVMAAVSERGSEAGLLDVLARASARLRGDLRLEVTPASQVAMRTASPQDAAAARAYAQGLARLRRWDLPQARELLAHSIEIEPGFAPAHAALASVEDSLGYESQARQEARRAFELGSALSNPDQKLAIDARYHEINKQWESAIEAYRRLFAAHPDDIEFGLQLAWAEIQGSRAQDALATLAALRRLPDPESGDPRIDFEAATAYFIQADYRGAVGLLQDSVRKAAAIQATLLYAYGLSAESAALLKLEDARWEPLSEESLRICRQFGEKQCVMAILRRMANARVMGGRDLAVAERDYDEAIRLAREIGSVAGEAAGLNGWALALGSRGELRRSVEVLQQVRALGQRIPSPGTEEMALDNLGEEFLAQGELKQARASVQAALALARSLNHHEWMADELRMAAQADQMQGDLAQARKLSEEAVAEARQGESQYLAQVLAARARVLWAEDDLPAAQRALAEAAPLFQKSVVMPAENRLIGALVALAGNRPAEAIALAREAESMAAARDLPQIEAQAESLLAGALLAHGNAVEAHAAARQAWARVAHSEYRVIRMEAGITLARVSRDGSGLAELIWEAHSKHAYELELDARLTAAELAHDSAQLAALRSEAAGRGYRYLARRTLN